MPGFEITVDADRDLVEIAWYTLDRWGAAQAERYLAALRAHLIGIGEGVVRSSPVAPD